MMANEIPQKMEEAQAYRGTNEVSKSIACKCFSQSTVVWYYRWLYFKLAMASSATECA